MGRKTESSVASTSNDETSSFLPEHQHTGTRNHKNRALAVFGEYMRYFSGVNSLYRNIVHLQAEVVSKHGRRGWKSLSQEDQDIALNRHIIDNSKIVISFKTNSENEENITTEGHSENEQISRSGSLQSISDQDCFSGPFSWRTKSLEKLAFPSTPELSNAPQQKEGSKQPTKKTNSKPPSATEASEASESEDEVMPSVTLDELRRELRKSYEEQQSSRLKMRQIEAEKKGGYSKTPERITKEAVKQMRSPTRNGRYVSDSGSGLPVSPSDLKPTTALRPVNKEMGRTFSDSSPIKAESSYQDARSTPAVIPRNGLPTEQRRQQKSSFTEQISPKKNHARKSLDFDEILKAAEESHRKRTETTAAKIAPSSRRDTEAGSSESSSRIGSLSVDLNSPEKKMTVREISEDWNQYFSQKSNSKSQPENSDIMDLFKNW